MIGDPRTMPLPELREAMQATYAAAEASWVFLAVGFNRIREGGYKNLGLDSWTAYLRSDFPRLSKSAVLRMCEAARYVGLTEPETYEGLLAGTAAEALGDMDSEGGGASATSTPGWYAVTALTKLRDKTLALNDAERHRSGKHLADNAVQVSPEKWREVHEGAFRGGWSERTVREEASRLCRGLTFVGGSPTTGTAAGDRVYDAARIVAEAAGKLLALHRALKSGEVPLRERKPFVEAIEDFFIAAVRVLGPETADLFVGRAKQRCRETTPSETPSQARDTRLRLMKPKG